MSDRADVFRMMFGRAQGRSNPPEDRLIQAGLDAELPAGRFKDGFLDFFLGWYDDVLPALDEWSFLVPASDTPRTVLCRNAHGVSVLLELGNEHRLSLFDPVRIRYEADLGVQLSAFVEDWLFTPAAVPFLDGSTWKAWRRRNRRKLPIDEGLLPILPIPLGGSWEPDNFQVEPFFTWTRDMGRILTRSQHSAG